MTYYDTSPTDSISYRRRHVRYMLTDYDWIPIGPTYTSMHQMPDMSYLPTPRAHGVR